MLVNIHFQKYNRYNFWKVIYTVQMGIWKLSKNGTLEKFYWYNKSFSLLTLTFNAASIE